MLQSTERFGSSYRKILYLRSVKHVKSVDGNHRLLIKDRAAKRTYMQMLAAVQSYEPRTPRINMDDASDRARALVLGSTDTSTIWEWSVKVLENINLAKAEKARII